MAKNDQYDVVVIGTGPGGYETAIRATHLGFKTAVIEKDKLGGVCLNVGCIPTKALLRSAEVLEDTRNLKSYGLELKGEVTPKFDKVIERSRDVAGKMNKGVEFLMKKNKIDVIQGEARLGNRTVPAGGGFFVPAGAPYAYTAGPEGVQVLEFRNVGSFDKGDETVGTGMVGAPACGDVMRLQIKVNEEGVIEDAKFKTYGCGSAIASSSLATEWLKGKTIDEALAIDNMAIVEELALPPVKIHCSVLAEDAIKSAIKDYKTKNGAKAEVKAEA